MPRRAPTPDWRHVGWPYKALHPIADALNRLVARVRVDGVEHVPVDGEGVLLVANHLTDWDPLLAMAPLPRPVNWLGQELVLRGTPVRRAFFRAVGVIPVDRTRGGNEAAVAEAVRRYREGRVVGVFPEGRLARDPLAPLPPRSGVGRVALATGARVVPCALRTEGFWPNGRLPRLRGPARVRYGAPFRVAADARAADYSERARCGLRRAPRDVGGSRAAPGTAETAETAVTAETNEESCSRVEVAQSG